MSIETEFLSEQQAADYFGWSVATMREIRKRGEIGHFIFNDKTVRYTKEQLQRYKERHLITEGETKNECL